MREWLALAMRRSIVGRASKVALLVGSALVIINQGDVLLGGDWTLQLDNLANQENGFWNEWCLDLYLSPDSDGPRFRRGDVDGNGTVAALLDALALLGSFFVADPPPPCLAAADVDGSGDVFALVDSLFLLVYGFTDGPPPPPPGPHDCGPDAQEVECETEPEDCTS